MNHSANKGNYRLVEDLFDTRYRKFLPINLYVLRDEISEQMTFDNRFYIKSSFHKNSKRFGGTFHKTISNLM